MMDKSFTVFLTGRMVPGRDQEQVKTALEKLFKINREKVNKLLSVSQFVVKKNVDYSTALKYQSALKSAGVFALIKPVEMDFTSNQAKPSEPHQRVKEKGEKSNSVPEVIKHHQIEESEETPQVQPQQNQTSLELAPVGVDFREGKSKIKLPLAPDVTHLSLDKVGVVISESHPAVPVKIPDVSHLTLSNIGERVADEVEHLAVITPDTSEMSLTTVGDKLVESNPKSTPPPPDTSSLKLTEKGANVADKKEKVNPEYIDISHLSLDS